MPTQLQPSGNRDLFHTELKTFFFSNKAKRYEMFVNRLM